jgi:hypothetical protein
VVAGYRGEERERIGEVLVKDVQAEGAAKTGEALPVLLLL